MSPRRGLGRLRHSPYAWSLVDHGLSSGTTLFLIAITARTLGPSGLGIVALGYAALLIALGFERALIIDPLLTRIQTSARSRHEAFEAAVSAAASGGLLLTLMGLAVGLSTTGTGARAMLLFSPWILPVMIHGLLKAWLYREGRAKIATASSAAWFVIMIGAVAVGLRSTDWQITAAWGFGACVAATVAGAGTSEKLAVAGPSRTLAWFWHEALGMGLWRATSSTVFSAADYVRAAGIASILGSAALGGYRAIETLFAPTSLIGPAFISSGLPPMRQAVEDQAGARAWSLAVKISGLSVLLVAAYVVVVSIAKDELIGIFGAEFVAYENLIVPIVVGQMLIGLGLGFGILLLAARRVRAVALLTILQAGVMLSLVLPLAAARGLEAAAWGIAFAQIPSLSLAIVVARRVVRALTLPAPAHTEWA